MDKGKHINTRIPCLTISLYHTTIHVVAINMMVITTVGFLAFITWVLFNPFFKKFLRKHRLDICP
ncbi:hypothetical protein FH5_04006 [Priestia endophytica]|nr:hypothetical protein FH5_04006 [Priestia endophytica]